MKRKLSLLMAAIMALSTLPFTATEVHASTNSITGHTVTAVVPNNTVFVEATAQRATDLRLPGNMASGGVAASNLWNISGPPNTAANVPFASQAGYMMLQNNTNVAIPTGATVAVELENAEWFFRGTPVFATAGTGNFWSGFDARAFNSASPPPNSGPDVMGFAGATIPGAGRPVGSIGHLFAQVHSDVPVGNLAASQSELFNLPDESNVLGAPGLTIPPLRDRLNSVLNASIGSLSTSGFADHRIGGGTLWIRTGTGSAGALPIQSTYEPSRGLYIPMSEQLGAVGRYLRFGYHAENAMPVPLWQNQGGREIPYIMDISPIPQQGAFRRASVTVLEPVGPGDAIRIPLVIRVTSEEEVVVNVRNEGFGGTFASTRHLFMAGGVGATIAYVINPEVSRDVFAVEQLVIRETRANSIRRIGTAAVAGNVTNANAFDMVLPPGFYFSADLPNMSTADNQAVSLQIGIESGGPGSLAWQGGRVGWGVPGTDFIAFWPAGYEDRRNRLRVVLTNFEESFNSPGALFLQNIVIHASEHAPFDVDIEISLENTELVAPGGRFVGNETAPQVIDLAPPGNSWRRDPRQNGSFFRTSTEANGGERVEWISQALAFVGAASDIFNSTDPEDTAPHWMDAELEAIFRNWNVLIAAGEWVQYQGVGLPSGWVSGGGVNANGVLIGNGIFDLDPADENALAINSVGVGLFRPDGFWGRDTVTGAAITANARNTVNMITATTVRAGTRRDWGIILRTEGDVPELISGRYVGPTSWRNVNHQAARVVFEESVPNSWWAGRQVILTLPEEVRWRSVHFVDVVGTNENMVLHNQTYVNFPGNTPLTGWVNAIPAGGTASAQGVRFDENRMYWNDVLAWRAGQIRNDRALLRFDSWVSIAAHFEGDIVLTASGTAIPREVYTVLPSTVIATALRPVIVEVLDGITDLRIGFQNQPTSTIRLTESRTGALMRDLEVRLSVTDLLATDIGFTPDTEVQVVNQAASGLRIRGVNTGLSGSLFGFGDGVPTLGVEANRGTIAFTIDYASHTAPGVIEMSNVGVRVDRTVPETNEQPYWVVVWGTAIASNFGPFNPNPNETWIEIPFVERTNNDRFMQAPGLFVDYVRVVTGGDGSAPFSAEVRVTIGEMSYWVNDERFDTDIAPVIHNDSTFVPLRFIANAFQIPDRDITWSDYNRTVTLILPQGRGVVQFFADEPFVTINGGERIPVTAYGGGAALTPLILPVDGEGGRIMLPFRFFGETILGVDVDWDETTQTAYFNPSARVRTHE